MVTMNVACTNCLEEYEIPRFKLPQGKKIAIKCLACEDRIFIDLRPQKGPEKPPATPEPGIKEPPAKASRPKSFNRKQPDGMKLKFGILRSISDLPAMPNVVNKAQKLISTPDSKLTDLVKVIEVEQSISARVLRLANSTYYGLSGKVATVQHASVLLGYKTLGEVISVAGISNLIDKTLEGYQIDSDDMWRHSMAVAVGSKLIAGKRNPALCDDAFLAGLMHDAGKLVLDRYVYERKEDFELFMQDGRETFLSAEKEILGFDHSEIASEFCEKWNIPGNQSLAIKFHHYPSQSEDCELAYILHAADVIAMMSGIGTGTDCELYQLENGALEFLDFQKEDIDGIQSEVVESVEDMMSGMLQ
jgi:HD-like signal output (HDOD) protein